MGYQILSKYRMLREEQNYYLWLYNTIPTLIVWFENHYKFFNFVYIIYSISNGFIYYLGNYLTAFILENISMNKFLLIICMNIVFFILGFFWKKMFILYDIFGNMLIIGFQIYNIVIFWGKIIDSNKININNHKIIKTIVIIFYF